MQTTWNVTFNLIECTIQTIRILEKFSKPSGVKSGVPSSMNDKSVRYMPKYGMQGGSHRCNASRIARKRPSEQTTDCSLDMVCLIWMPKRNAVYNLVIIDFVLMEFEKRFYTVFGTLSHVFFKRKTAAFVKAAHTCKTPLKLCRQRQMSATAVHFSMAATRACMLFLIVFDFIFSFKRLKLHFSDKAIRKLEKHATDNLYTLI